MNEARLEELKKILNERHQNLEQGLQEDFNAQNFDIPNSDASNFNTSDLNSANSKILNFDDKNSDSSNSNTRNDSKFQNLHLYHAASNKNSRAQIRDYDKEPIVIKDHTYYEFMIYQFPALLIGFIIFLTFATIVNPVSLKTFRMLPSILVSLLTVIRDKDGMYFEFKNDKILYYHKNKIRKIFELNSIGAMVISFDCRHSMRQRVNWFIRIALILWILLIFAADAYDMTIGESITDILCIFILAASGIFGAKAIMHLRNGSLSFFGLHDQLVLYKENAEVEILNILMANKEEYVQLRDYFMQTMQKDISNLARTMSIFNKKIEFRKFKF
ncbi:hypothetical protein [uncultured Campylobacter sp.]|uniref:hypothetical protein n=1 Tax=uncultured Campylobacter sp. TaxID=218934 RepID=UPI00260DD0CD|nr:hypothetical protein [uncultured Campylobacter sp.]